MDRAARRAIEWDVAQRLLRFYEAFDDWDYGRMAEVFTPDGVWHRAGKVLAGRAAIVAELEQRPRAQTVRHVLTNLVVDVADAGQAQARAYLTVYRHDGAGARQVPAPMALPAMLLLVQARFRREQDDWRIEEQVMRREFVAGG